MSESTASGAAKKRPTSKPNSNLKIKRENKVNEIKEYQLTKKSGATFLLQQKNVMTMYEGIVREIRYCPNETSIFRDQQNEASRREPIIFTEGRLFVLPSQPNLSDYLEAHPDNVKNGGNRYFLVDQRKNSEEKLKNEFLSHDAIGMIRSKPLDELLIVATALGINVDREVAEIKHDLMVYAKRNPKRFIESFDDPLVEMRSLLTQAIKFQIIRTDNKGVYWVDNGKTIISVPEGRDALDVMTRYCMEDKAFATVESIKNQLR